MPVNFRAYGAFLVLPYPTIATNLKKRLYRVLTRFKRGFSHYLGAGYLAIALNPPISQGLP
jgi:hypothetical protein